MAAVEWTKRLGVQGKIANVVSLVLGIALGIGYQLSQAVPTDFGGWFGAVLYGLALGLTASGLYDAGTGVVARALGRR
ncbi:MAG: hypothetical protein IT318_23675 [Anaerolineales bacterium]|nr:hypothetical protein [Anaerolineales bacterium]